MVNSVFTPHARTILDAGSRVWLEWEDPTGQAPSSFELSYSDDGGATWTPVFVGFTDHRYHWTVPPYVTTEGMLELVAVDAIGPMGAWLQPDIEVRNGVTGVEQEAPEAFGLKFSGRNPAAGSAQVELALPTASKVEVRIHDVRGAVVRNLAEGELGAGIHRLHWDGRDQSGRQAPAGVYFVRAAAGDQTGRVRFVFLH
jgi:hypothetical protein